MRGTLGLFGGELAIRGIIPADAGNTRRRVTAFSNAGDHPRGCGEHSLTLHRGSLPCGSSPRMRGTLLPFGHCGHTYGIIPADAGNTSVGIEYVWLVEDHPRGCGEHSGGRTCDGDVGGSSPRMRGTRGYIGKGVMPIRIIPADAGNTSV